MTDAVRSEWTDRSTPPRATTREQLRLRDTWPLDRHDAGVLVGAYALMVAVWFGIGRLVTGPLEDTWLIQADRDASEWFAARRTETWNSWAHAGAMLADTVVKIVATAIIAGVMLAVWRRWREPLLVAVALIVEASAFITITWLVGRPRPDVPRLETSPVASSFPSGHTAAAAAYTAITIVIFWHTRTAWIRIAAVVLTIALPVIVGVSRAYAGMHYTSDVIAGAALGYVAVLATWLVLRRPDDERGSAATARRSE